MTGIAILFLDDGSPPVRAYAAQLAHPQRELVMVATVDAAIDALLATRFALVLAYTANADAAGFALARGMRADERTEAVTLVLVLPDGAEPALAAQAWGSGAADVVCESMSIAALEHKINVFAGFHNERQRLVELAANLDQALKANELCAAMLAHDLRNPLTAVLTAAELLQRELPPEVVRSTALRLRSSGRRMQVMVERLLYVARVRAGTLRMRFEALDLASLVAQIVDEFDDGAAGNVSFQLRGRADIEADEGAIGQVLSNLIGNAVRYGESGGEVQVLIDGDAADAVRLRVANRGSLSDDMRQRMRAAQPILHGGAGAGAGAGLGLYIVHQLVTLHRGCVEVDSDASSGTAVTVTIPRRAAHVTHPCQPAQAES